MNGDVRVNVSEASLLLFNYVVVRERLQGDAGQSRAVVVDPGQDHLVLLKLSPL